VKKRSGTGMPVGWLITAFLGLLLFVGAVVGGLWWITQKVDDESGPPVPPPMAAKMPGVPQGGGAPPPPTLDGKDGEPHDVPKGPFPPAGFPPKQNALTEDHLIAVENPILNPGKDEKDPPTKPAAIGPEAKAAAKSGAVYIRVGGGSGSGFFASPDAPNLVVTNAHVVGMVAPGTHEPPNIEVFVHSGQKNEKRYKGRLVGIDRASDLAVIDIGVKQGLPKPLRIRSATSLDNLDVVYVFGFPLGEQLGKEITARDTTVSALRRRRDGMLEKIQVKGGMDPGNSGGPVVDTNGHLIGVSVAIIVGREIAFAIPSDLVNSLLYGRVSGMGVGQPVKKGEKIAAPFKVEMIDPLGRIKEAGLEVWTGDAPTGNDRTRPAATSAPAALPGDSARTRAVGAVGPLHEQLKTRDQKLEGRLTLRKEIDLPPLPVGKVYWVQPTWVRKSGETIWGQAWVYKAGEPLTPKNVDLRSHFEASEKGRRVLVSVSNRMYIQDSDSETTSTTYLAGFSERVASVSPTGPSLTLFYQGAGKSSESKQNQPDGSLESMRSNLKMMKAKVQLDDKGNVTQNQFVVARSAPQDASMQSFHDAVKNGMDAAYLALPNTTVKPRDTWKPSARSLAMGERPGSLGHPSISQTANLDLTCTYLGTRTRESREEAIIDISGRVSGGHSGRVYGQMIVDVATGTVRSVEMNVNMDVSTTGFSPTGGAQTIKIRLTKAISLQRDL
jgi:hypothetical protein